MPAALDDQAKPNRFNKSALVIEFAILPILGRVMLEPCSKSVSIGILGICKCIYIYIYIHICIHLLTHVRIVFEVIRISRTRRIIQMFLTSSSNVIHMVNHKNIGIHTHVAMTLVCV